ncbi:MAG: hypothetical protein VX223_15830 [Myxococcota bacterium]|nr:hypothetical protein [Myxococcota bacterium]
MSLHRSAGLIMVRDRSFAQLAAAIDSHFRFWGFVRHSGDQNQLAAMHPAERREFIGVEAGVWVGVRVEHLTDLFELGYSLSKHWPDHLVFASRLYSYGLWEFKAYLDRDLQFKVGDDPDHELPWVGRPLDAERKIHVQKHLPGPIWSDFLDKVIDDSVVPNDLLRSLKVDPSLAFSAAYKTASERYIAWYRR